MKENTNDLVSVVVTCFNYGMYLDDALRSLKEQTYKNLEVIVVDDESTDQQTRETLDLLEKRYPRFSFFRITHRGVAETRNFGIKKSHGSFVFVLDADDKVDETYVSRCVSYLKRHPKHQIVTTYVKMFGKENGVWRTGKYDLYKLCTQNVLQGSSMFRRNVFELTGGYDKQYPGYEDWDFWLSAAIKGCSWGLIPLALLFYRIKEKSMFTESSKNDENIYVMLIKKHASFFHEHYLTISRKFREELLFSNKFHQKLISNSEVLIEEMETTIKNIDFENRQQRRSNQMLRDQLVAIKREKRKTELSLRKELAHFSEKVDQLESERIENQSILRSFSCSRYIQIKRAIQNVHTISTLFLLPIKIFYIIAPQRLKNFWRKTKQIARLRLYSERKWPDERPLVSVIIPVFNYGQYLRSAIKSVQDQTYSSYEIIIVEGGSTDGLSPELVRKIHGPNIRKYFRKKRHYAGSNRDFGIRKARGKYILGLDPDDKIDPTFLEKTLFMAETYHYDIVGSWLKSFGSKRYIYRLPPTPVLEDEIVDNKINQTSLFRKDLYFRVGGYKDFVIPGKKRIAEDWEFWVRMLAEGARVYNIQEPLMLYRHHKKNITVTMPVLDHEAQSKKIRCLNKLRLTQSAFNRSIRRRDLLFLNVFPRRNIRKEVSKKSNFFSAVPLLAVGGADLVYQQVERALSHKCLVHTVADVPVFPEMEAVIESHKDITQRVYETYKLVPYQFGGEGRLYAYATREVVKYLLAIHPPDSIYQGGSRLWYRLLPYIKNNYPSSLVVDNQFNTEGHVGDLIRFQHLIDAVMVEGRFMKRFVEKHLKKKIPVFLAAVGVDTARFKPRRKKHVLFGRKIDTGMLVVSFVGRFSEEKGVDIFLKVAKKMNGSKILFLLAGYGPLEDFVRNLIENDPKSYRNVVNVGCVKDPSVVYTESDVVVVPSKNDGVPNVVKEALASGVVVIGSRVGGIPEMLCPREGVGILCKIGDVNCIVKNIFRLTKNSKILEHYKSIARLHALRRFSQKDFAEKCEGIFCGSN